MTKHSKKEGIIKVIKVRGGGEIINESTDPAFNGEDNVARTYQITNPINPVGMPSGPGLGGRRRARRTKTFPRGILRKTAKINPSKNPSKAPPTRRSVKLLTVNGSARKHKMVREKTAKMGIDEIRKRLVEKKVISPEKKNIPPTVLRTLYSDSVNAGLLS
jgi:hypothetical protein